MATITRQLIATTFFLADGVTTEWNFSFAGGYLDKSHVKAYKIDPAGLRTDITVTPAMVTGAAQLTLTPAVENGYIFCIYRDTPKDLPLVDFTDESGLSEIALDTNAKQAVFIGAESSDNQSATAEAQAAASDAAASAAIASAAADASELAKDQSIAVVDAATTLYNGVSAVNAAVTAASNSASSASSSAASALSSANAAAVSAANATTTAQTVFNANTTAFTRTVLDDANATAARATLGAAASGANTDITSISGSAASAPWSGVTGKPTTVAGYGINDMGTQSVNYANTAGNGGVTSVNGMTGAVTIADPTTAQVTAATAGLALGGVGTYAFLAYITTGTQPAPGSTFASTSLRFSSGDSGVYVNSPLPVGTWRCLGVTTISVATARATLWVRIA